MAVGVLTAAPQFTKEIYDKVTEKMFGHAAPMGAGEAPDGLMVHSAGQGDQGYYVYDICVARGLRALHGGEARPRARRGHGRATARGRRTAVLPDRRAGHLALSRHG